MLLDRVEIVRLDNREVVLTGNLVRGMPCVVLDDVAFAMYYFGSQQLE